MEAKVTFFVRGNNPYVALRTQLLRNGILRNDFGLPKSIVAQRQIGTDSYVYSLSLHELQRLQLLQGIPFQGFRGTQGAPLEPKSILVVAKDTQDEAHQTTLRRVEASLRGLGISFKSVNVKDLTPGALFGFDVVVPVGGDGTFLRTAHFANSGLPFVGIVSDPQAAKTNPLGSWGNYLPLTADKLEEALDILRRGEYELESLTRLSAHLTQGSHTKQTLLALNEIFVNEQDSAHTAKYFLEAARIRELMSDSGLLVSTGSGSSANAWISNAGGLSFSPISQLLQFKLREPASFIREGHERLLLHGFADQLLITSAMHYHPRVSIDGAAAHYPFPYGTELRLAVADQPLSFAVFPSIATGALVPPNGRAAEISSPTKFLELPVSQIGEIEDLPICSTVPAGTKRQILFLQITPDMKQLNLVRLLKTGGVPLTSEDFKLEATIENPTLLYPTAEINALSSGIRDIVLGLYTYGLRLTDFADTLVEWDASIDKNVWAPSIDTIVLMKSLLDHVLPGGRIVSAAEVGTGAGGIAKLIAQNSPNIKNLTITDIEKKAIECALRNLAFLGNTVNIQAIIGNGVRLVGKVDLLVVNPPYLPEKEVSGEVDQYRGLGLIEEVLRDGKKHLNPGGSVVINYSSCAGKEFDEWVKQYGWNVKILDKVTVPLKIVRVNDDPAWLDFMLEHGGLEIRDDNETGYCYWHTLNVVQLTPIQD